MSIPGEDPEAIPGHAGKIMSLDWLGNASVSFQKSQRRLVSAAAVTETQMEGLLE